MHLFGECTFYRREGEGSEVCEFGEKELSQRRVEPDYFRIDEGGFAWHPLVSFVFVPDAVVSLSSTLWPCSG